MLACQLHGQLIFSCRILLLHNFEMEWWNENDVLWHCMSFQDKQCALKNFSKKKRKVGMHVKTRRVHDTFFFSKKFFKLVLHEMWRHSMPYNVIFIPYMKVMKHWSIFHIHLAMRVIAHTKRFNVKWNLYYFVVFKILSMNLHALTHELLILNWKKNVWLLFWAVFIYDTSELISTWISLVKIYPKKRKNRNYKKT